MSAEPSDAARDADAGEADDAGPGENVTVLDRQGVRRLASGHPWIRADHVAEVCFSHGLCDDCATALYGPAPRDDDRF